jgi:predicted aspartyl protease
MGIKHVELTIKSPTNSGKKLTREIGNASITYGNDEIITPVVLGQKGDSPLLGTITLESFGLLLDPFKRKLYKSTMML